MISVRGLSLRLEEFDLHDINLEIGEREYFVILGQTGAGKTLLIESIAGLLRPQKGRIWIAGRDVTDLRPEDRRVGYLPQDYALFPHLSVKENIAFGMKIAKRPAPAVQAKIAELADLLGIGHLLHRDVIHLSGGERQRTALARALAIEPKVLLLDEPLSALDEQTRENLCGELRRVHEEFGTTTVHISHSFEETLSLADRIAVINAGRVEQVGPPAEVMCRPATEFAASFVRCQNVLPGHAWQDGQITRVKIEGAEIYSASPAKGKVTVAVRPEEIILFDHAPSGDSPNLFRARVRMVMGRGALTRVDLEAEAKISGSRETPAQARFTSLCSRQQSEGLALAPGKKVFLSFDPRVVHLICQNQGPGAGFSDT